MRTNINSFNSGEVSPLLAGRTDLDSLKRAALQMRNFLPLATGGVSRRPALVNVAASDTMSGGPPTDGDPGVHTRLIPFTASTSARYLIQVSPAWIKVWGQDGTLAAVLTMGFPGTVLQGCSVDAWDPYGVYCASTAGLAPGMSLTCLGVMNAGATIDTIVDSTSFRVTSISVGGTGSIGPVLAGSVAALAGCSTTLGSTTVSCAGTMGLQAGMTVYGSTINNGVTTITSITDATHFEISQAALTTGSGLVLKVSLVPSFQWPSIRGLNVDQISFAQVNDVLFLAHQSLPPLMLSRHGERDWRLSTFATEAGDDFWPPVLDEQVTPSDPADEQEGITFARTFTATAAAVFGQVVSTSQGASAPCPGVYRLYITGATSYTGNLKIAGFDSTSGTAVTLGTFPYTALTTAVPSLVQEWFHQYNFLQISATRTSGSGSITISLRHVGSVKAPTVWRNGAVSYAPGSNLVDMYISPGTWAGYRAGEAVQIGHLRRNIVADIKTTAVSTPTPFTSASLFVFGDWEAFSTGIWTGQVYLEAQDSNGRWDIIRTWTAQGDYNFSASGTEVPGRTLRLRAELTSTTATGTSIYPRFSLKAKDGVMRQWLRLALDGAGSRAAMTAMGGVDMAILLQSTTAVARGAFSPAQGYPAAVCIHDERVYFGGTVQRPTTAWASGVNDLLNFRRTGYDDGGFMFQIAANEGNPITSMVSGARGVVMLTQGDEWLIDGDEKGLTPTNITARRQSRYGAAFLQALPAAGSLLFVQRGGMAVRDYQYDWASQAYSSPELSELIQHITSSGVRSMAYSGNPAGTLWCVMNDGSMLSCSYNRAQQVIAWAKHTTAGSFESVAVVYGDTSQADEVWFLVKRGSRRFLEKLDTNFGICLQMQEPLPGGLPLPHLDSLQVCTQLPAPSLRITGLDRFIGQTVSVVSRAQLAWLGDHVVADDGSGGGYVTLDAWHPGDLYAGLPFTSTLQPMPFEVPLADGTSQGRKVMTPALSLNLYRTCFGQWKDSPDGGLFTLKLPGADAVRAVSSPGFTGVLQVASLARVADTVQPVFTTSRPEPFNILAVVPCFNLYGN